MDARLIRVALTGGIGTGKSYCLDRFAAHGAKVVSADGLAREVMAPATPAFEAVVARFGPEIVRNGAIDRRALAALVFRDAHAREALEAIVHPGVYARLREWFAEVARTPRAATTVAMADIPLLFETGHEREFDRVVLAACTPATQLARVMARDGLTAAEAQVRINAQWPIDEKRAHADFIIETEGTFSQTDRQVDDVWAALQAADPDA